MDNLLQGFGLVACIGALLLVVAVVWIARSVMGRRNTGGLFGGTPGVDDQAGYGNRGGLRDAEQEVFTRRGSERPTYDSPDVRSGGGFGEAIPNTGRDANPFEDRERQTRDSFDQPGGGPLRNIDAERTQQPPVRRGGLRRRGGGGGNIKSGGGFGGG